MVGHLDAFDDLYGFWGLVHFDRWSLLPRCCWQAAQDQRTAGVARDNLPATKSGVHVVCVSRGGADDGETIRHVARNACWSRTCVCPSGHVHDTPAPVPDDGERRAAVERDARRGRSCAGPPVASGVHAGRPDRTPTYGAPPGGVGNAMSGLTGTSAAVSGGTFSSVALTHPATPRTVSTRYQRPLSLRPRSCTSSPWFTRSTGVALTFGSARTLPGFATVPRSEDTIGTGG